MHGVAASDLLRAFVLRIVGIGADGRTADEDFGQLARIVPRVGVRAVVGDVAGGVVGVAVAAHGRYFVAGGRHGRCRGAAVDFGQAVGRGIVGVVYGRA